MSKIVRCLLATGAFVAAGAGVETAHAREVFCPLNLTATWIGAPSGRTNFINSITSRLSGPLPPPTNNLTCVLPGDVNPNFIRQVVQLQPNSVPSACGGKATFTGQGTRGPGTPIPGFIFKSKRVDGVPTYTPATGRCQLDIALLPTLVTLKVSENCTPHYGNSWTCPDSAVPLSASDANGTPDDGVEPALALLDGMLSESRRTDELWLPAVPPQYDFLAALGWD